MAVEQPLGNPEPNSDDSGWANFGGLQLHVDPTSGQAPLAVTISASLSSVN